MNRHKFSVVVVSFLVLIVLASVTNAQSKDQDNPTPLISSVVSGTLSPDNKGDKYYYSFVASPGDVTVALTVEGENKQISGSMPAIVQAGFALLDEREVQLVASKPATTGAGYTAQTIENISVKRRQRVVILIYATQYNTGYGKYRLKVSGAVEFGQHKSTIEGENLDPIASAVEASRRASEKDNFQKCLPKQGTLIIKMKDGSKKIIDLSEAETITVVP